MADRLPEKGGDEMTVEEAIKCARMEIELFREKEKYYKTLPARMLEKTYKRRADALEILVAEVERRRNGA